MVYRHTRCGGILAVALAATGFGCISVLAKHSYEAGSSATSLLVTRLAVAGVLLAPVAAVGILRARKNGLRSWRPVLFAFLAGVAFAAGATLEFQGLERLSAATLVVLLFLAPVWVALGSWLLWRRRLGRRGVASLALALGGVALLAGLPQGWDIDASGAAYGISASLLFAGVFLLIEGLVGRLSAPATVGVIASGAAVASVPLAPAGPFVELADPATARTALAIGLLTAGSLLLLGAGMIETPAFAASLVAAAEPVVAAALGWILLGESLTPTELGGALAIVTGGVAAATDRAGRAS